MLTVWCIIIKSISESITKCITSNLYYSLEGVRMITAKALWKGRSAYYTQVEGGEFELVLLVLALGRLFVVVLGIVP